MESTKTFSVRFILRHTIANSTDAGIYARITYDKKRAELGVDRNIDPDCWNPEKQCATGSRELMNRINPHLEEIRFKLTESFYKLKSQNSYITADAIKRHYTGDEKITNSLLSLFEYHMLNSKEVLKWVH